jgi:hypothetical protein
MRSEDLKTGMTVYVALIDRTDDDDPRIIRRTYTVRVGKSMISFYEDGVLSLRGLRGNIGSTIARAQLTPEAALDHLVQRAVGVVGDLKRKLARAEADLLFVQNQQHQQEASR